MEELRLDGRVAIITGAGGGLGRSHALELATRGAIIVVNDLGCALDGSGASSDPAAKVAGEIVAAGGIAVADSSSVATPAGGQALIDHALSEFGRIDIVVNNAGILRDKTFHGMEPEMVVSVMDVHLLGAFWVTKPAWVHMREQGYGRVVNTTSDSGIFGNFGQANYAAAKTGLIGLTRVLAVEGARHGIKVNAIAPVGRTRMTEQLLDPKLEEPKPSQVSAVVTWLVHDDCPVSGEIVQVRRGRIARIFIGRTAGYINHDPTPEDIRDHFSEAWDLTEFVIPEVGKGR